MRRTLLACLVCSLLIGCGDDGSAASGVSQKPAPKRGTGTAEAGDPEGHGGSTDRDRWPSAALRRLEPGHEPTPYSALQIAMASGPETKRVMAFQQAGRDPIYKCWTYTDPTPSGATWHDAVCDSEGKEIGAKTSKPITWVGQQRHASWPAEMVTTSEAQQTTPAGTFDCMHYVVKRTARQGAAEDRYWYAWALPGPPVRLERYVNGTLEFSMTLVKVEGVGAK